MKKLLGIVALTGMLAACNNKAPENTSKVLGVSEVDSQEFARFQEWKQMQLLEEMKKQAAQEKAANQPIQERVVYRDRIITQAPAPVPVQERNKMSHAAKGAIIGTGTGAAAGAIIHKRDRVLGGVVGGVIGGVGGYTIGRGMDKKQGR